MGRHYRLSRVRRITSYCTLTHWSDKACIWSLAAHHLPVLQAKFRVWRLSRGGSSLEVILPQLRPSGRGSPCLAPGRPKGARSGIRIGCLCWPIAPQSMPGEGTDAPRMETGHHPTTSKSAPGVVCSLRSAISPSVLVSLASVTTMSCESCFIAVLPLNFRVLAR